MSARAVHRDGTEGADTHLEVDEVRPVVPEAREVDRADKVPTDAHPEAVQERCKRKGGDEHRDGGRAERGLRFGCVHGEEEDAEEAEERGRARVQTN